MSGGIAYYKRAVKKSSELRTEVDKVEYKLEGVRIDIKAFERRIAGGGKAPWLQQALESRIKKAARLEAKLLTLHTPGARRRAAIRL